MSYQIKSTPFFQRILTTSKLNGQLQMLKEEYERMNFINDHKIERKMREVRLKRLFKEIDEIREANSKKQKLEVNINNRAKVSKRLLNWRKTKSLGQYYSERNLENTISDSDMGIKRKILPQSKSKTEFEQKTSVLKKGIKYGNEISDWNMQNIKLRNLKKEIIQRNTQIQKKTPNGKEKIRKKVHNNNNNKVNEKNVKENSSTAHKNKSCRNKSMLAKKCLGNTSVISLGENVQLIDFESGDENIFRSCDNLHETILVDNANIQVMLSSSDEYIKGNRAIKLWRKLFALIKSNIQISQQLKTLQNLKGEKYEPCSTMEYQLRSISNGTNLLETDIIPNRTEQFNKNLIEKEDDCNNERLINSEYLIEANLPKSVDDELPRYPPPPPSPPPILIPTFSQKKLSFNPIMKPSEDNYIDACDNQKENYKLKVVHLRSLFEHQNK